jgi:putative sigma-54 modulation protein
MNINIQSVHFDADKKLLDFINKKVTKLSVFYNGIINSDVILRLDKNQEKENKITEIKIKGRKGEFFARKQCNTFEEATDMACEALKSQIKKFKDRQFSK